MKRSHIALLLLFLPILLSVSGCSDARYGTLAFYSAQLRVLLASPDAPNLDILVNDDVTWVDVAFQEGSGYRNVPPDDINIKIDISGTPQTLIDEWVTVEKGAPHSLIVVGLLADIETLLLEDDDTAPDVGKVKVRVVQGSASQPAIDIYITEPNVPLEFAVPILQNVALKDTSNFFEMLEGEYQVRITLPWEIEPIYDSGTITLDGRSIITAAVVDAAGGFSPVGVVLLTDDKQEPVVQLPDIRSLVRVIHASPDAATFIDVFVDDTELFSNAHFKGASDYQEVNAGNRNIRVDEALNPVTLITQTVGLLGGKDYSLLLANFVDNIELLLLPDDRTAPMINRAKVRFIHASPDAPDIDVLVDGVVVLAYVPFKGITDYLEVWVGDRELRLNEAGTTNMLAEVMPIPTLEDGKVYTLMAAGDLEDIDAVLLMDN